MPPTPEWKSPSLRQATEIECALDRDQVVVIQSQVDSVRDVMQQNVDIVLENHANSDALTEKTERLGTFAKGFQRRTRVVKEQQWWKDKKLTVVVGIVLAFAVITFIFVPIFTSDWFNGIMEALENVGAVEEDAVVIELAD